MNTQSSNLSNVLANVAKSLVILTGLGLANLAPGQAQPTLPQDADTHLEQTDARGSDGGLGTGVYVLDRVLGDPQAPVVIVEYQSWTCLFCQRFHQQIFGPIIRPAIENGIVRFISRDSIHNGIDLRVGLAARCEGIEYEAALDALFENQSSFHVNDPEAADTAIVAALADLGMDAEKYAACLEDQTQANFLKHISDQGLFIGVSGTPSVFINGRKLDNLDLPDLGEIIVEVGLGTLNPAASDGI